MHGLIFETSIWLLAGSTRFLRIKTWTPERKVMNPKTNLHSLLLALCGRTNAENSIFITDAVESRDHLNLWFKPSILTQLTLQRMHVHSPQPDAIISNSSKVPIQIPKHFTAPKNCKLVEIALSNPLRLPIQKRKQQKHNQLKYFFNAKTYTQELDASANALTSFLLPLHEKSTPFWPCLQSCSLQCKI